MFALTCFLVAAGGWLSAGGGHGRAQPANAVLALAFTATAALLSEGVKGLSVLM